MLAAAFAVAMAGCSLNPQPLPPGGGGDPTGADLGASADASTGFASADAADSGNDGRGEDAATLEGGEAELRDAGAESGDGG
jgi:hypothetical protein